MKTIVQPHVNLRSSDIVWPVDIADVKSRTGLTAATLHHYESIGLISPTGRVGLRRQYADDVIETLAVIVLCQRSGFTLDEVTQLLARQRNAEWKSMARNKLAEIEARIQALEHARDGLQHALDCKSRDILRCEHFQARLGSVFSTHLATSS
jgi:DNA-binding transcriptional MerR regulator